MSKIQKLVEEFLANPRNIRYSQIEKILLYFRCEKIRAKGSHIKFKHKNFQRDLIIPIHNNDCLNLYKKIAQKRLKELFQFYEKTAQTLHHCEQ